MNALKRFVLFLIPVSVCACNDGDGEIQKADFSVLGVTSIAINGTTYRVNDDMQLELANTDDIFISGTQMAKASRHYTIEYTVISSTQKTPSVAATCCYSDAAVTVSTNTTTSGITCKVIAIGRSGYDEHVTYKFYFPDL